MRIGPYPLGSRIVLAPMAGVTDLPFRTLCRRFGAALAPSEMISADTRLWTTSKSRHRLNHDGEAEPRVVQLAGADPAALAHAARMNVALGAQIIDLNMGCPAKKVCGRLCGSALLTDEPLVARILDAVVAAVSVPVTLKIRTGWDASRRNGVKIACLAERAGVAALAVHGRTRADFFNGAAEYDTIRAIKSQVRIPVFANGDIDSAQRAHEVLDFTGADGVMIGRASHGAPWIFRTVNAQLDAGIAPPPLLRAEVRDIILAHLDSLYAFYGEDSGVRIARKHLGWYCEQLLEAPAPVRRELLAAADTAAQFAHTVRHFGCWVNAGAALA
ncbi:MAG: tRNA dihydrouridine synthase DusB [Gammaproteobacteria bacterium]|nr:tRNA dihydrouridine synthase DusB [Gammaproteobacteria bacterium]MBV9621166.1 tRNA dihydrouridine synthase DusB [Gammaproteobacteria bacterium]